MGKIGFVPQLPPPLKMPVDELIRFTAGVGNVDPAGMEAVAERMGLDLAAIRRRPFLKLSGGMKQKLLIAIALGRDAQVLIMDEPAANLDPAARQVLFALLEERRAGSMIISSHRLDEVASLVTRVIELDKGRVVLDDRVENVLSMAAILACRVTIGRPDAAFARAIAEWRFREDRRRRPAALSRTDVALRRPARRHPDAGGDGCPIACGSAPCTLASAPGGPRLIRNLVLAARLDLAESLRARWFLTYTLIFGGIVVSLLLFGLTESRVMGFTGLSRLLVTYIQLAMAILPVFVLISTVRSVAGDREAGAFEYMLSLPVSLGAWYWGKLIGRFVTVFLHVTPHPMPAASRKPPGWSWSGSAPISAAFRSARRRRNRAVISAAGSVPATDRIRTSRGVSGRARRRPIW